MFFVFDCEECSLILFDFILFYFISFVFSFLYIILLNVLFPSFLPIHISSLTFLFSPLLSSSSVFLSFLLQLYPIFILFHYRYFLLFSPLFHFLFIYIIVIIIVITIFILFQFIVIYFVFFYVSAVGQCEYVHVCIRARGQDRSIHSSCTLRCI